MGKKKKGCPRQFIIINIQGGAFTMGLKTTNYEVKDLGITVPTAYAQVTSLFIDKAGNAYADFSIQQNRDDIGTKEAFTKESISCTIDKTQPIYTQVYNNAKETIFKDWEDDIVDETATETETVQ